MPDSWLTTLGKAFARPDTSQEHVRFTTASPLVNITDEDINRGINVGLSAGPGSIRAYHGSPYDFARFDMSKIGSGEGAQAYGHGLYFAENPKVAEGYKSDLAMQQMRADPNLSEDHFSAWNWLHENNYDQKAASEAVEKRIGQARQYNDPAWATEELKREKAIIDSGWQPPRGKMYQVDINAEPEHFMNWDAPLSQQHPKVQQAVESVMPGVSQSPHLSGEISGDLRHLYNELSRQAGGPAAASAKLHDAGIPGIKYLDQGSRGTGEGSSNYAVFGDKFIDIVKKYGLAGLLAAPAFVPKSDKE